MNNNYNKSCLFAYKHDCQVSFLGQLRHGEVNNLMLTTHFPPQPELNSIPLPHTSLGPLLVALTILYGLIYGPVWDPHPADSNALKVDTAFYVPFYP